MPDNDAAPSEQPADTRKKRPDVQIYRPGMLRLGVDVTKQPASSGSSDAPTERSRPPSSQSNRSRFHDERQNCPTFDNHHREREDDRGHEQSKRGNRRYTQRRIDQRQNAQAPSSEDLFRPPSQQSNKSHQSSRSHQPYKQNHYAGGYEQRRDRDENRFDRGGEGRDCHPPGMPNRPRGNRRRNVSHRSVQSERPASNRWQQQTDDSDAQSVYTDTMSNFGENELNDRSLRSQTSQSSLNSAATASDFMKPSMESLLSQDLPTIDWMEEVNRAEEEMKSFQEQQQQERAQDPTTPTATPRHGPSWRRQPPEHAKQTSRGALSTNEWKNSRGGQAAHSKSPRQVLSPASSNRSLTNSNIPVPQKLPMKDRIQRVQHERHEASRNGDHDQNSPRILKNHKRHEYRQQRPLELPRSLPTASHPSYSGQRMAILDRRLPKLREGEAAKSPTTPTPTTPTPPSGNSTATASPNLTPASPRKDMDADWVQIKNLATQMDQLCAVIKKSWDESTADDISELSKKLATLYGNYIKRNLRRAYAKSMELALWKNCFHPPVDALRVAGQGSREKTRRAQCVHLALIEQALQFYQELIAHYEDFMGASFDDLLYWPNGLPSADLVDVLSEKAMHKEIRENKEKKYVLESAQRLFLAVGDLNRYKVAAEGVQDYSKARLWYLKAAQLHAANGRSYNQLGLLAAFAVIQRRPLPSRLRGDPLLSLAHKLHKQRRWIDVVYFFVRALAAKTVYDSARQALESGFNEVAKRAVHWKQVVLNVVNADGKLTKREEVEMDYDDRVREIWYLPDGSEKRDSRDSKTVSYDVFLQLPIEELYNATVMHCLHVTGLLVTKIGMENFAEYAELALGELTALLSLETSPLNAFSLLQITASLIFSVHNAALKGGNQETCSAQQFTALQAVLSLWTVLMTVVRYHLEELVEFLETGKAPSKLLLVLPATCIICEWIATPLVHGIYRTMPTLEGTQSRFVQTEPWPVLASIANKLAPLHSDKLAAVCSPNNIPGSGPKIEAFLPELVLLSSFCNVFPPEPVQLVILPTSCKPNLDESDGERIALHARVHSILTAAEYLDGSELHCFTYDTVLQQFCAMHVNDETAESTTPTAPSPVRKSRSSESDGQPDLHEVLSSEAILMKENILKERLLAEERSDTRSVMEVRPEYLIVDTNAFVDYLGSVEKLIESRKFAVLIPTIVLTELKGLSSSPGAAASLLPAELDDTSEHEKYVTENAKKAITFLRKAADTGLAGISTITSKGDRLPKITFAVENIVSTSDKQVNDDYILNSCVELSKKMKRPGADSTTASDGDGSRQRIERAVVLLTDDRALRIKAMAARIPVRAVPEFMRWCGV